MDVVKTGEDTLLIVVGGVARITGGRFAAFPKTALVLQEDMETR
jgi:hypothetical protein